MNDPLRQPVPQVQKSAQLQQLENALASAESHLATLRGRHAHNAAAIRNQERIVAQYRARIAELTTKDDSWLN